MEQILSDHGSDHEFIKTMEQILSDCDSDYEFIKNNAMEQITV